VLATHRLPDGTLVVVRPIRADDRVRLGAAFTQLSAESARRRFLGPKPRLSGAELTYLTSIDGHDHVALVATLADDPGAIVAVGRFVRDPEQPDQAEVAIVVGDPWQGLGLGRRLGALLADEARAHGVRRFTATMLSDNVAAHRLFAAISERLHAEHRGGVEELVAELAAA
jgi:RimJ/RimL family protein N-acetyltransferase